ncbi:microviridin/marinostatin family tricyclic proteinase inhibitor [Vibrio sp. S9_S30]|uniref:microviridin/marinostatin family tricyclic proteinase inhibitor n=1 Tax=Vibrio sp. S9_S30 TaxID=2720226 RepID=UPI00167FFCF2|nr:microviridin/marinostatin family tricyclic proteinase inhibitor [Vibrio sp. S9_S30]
MNKNTPFFSHFIESQIEELSAQETKQCAGGYIGNFDVVTMKAPSDDDEGLEFVLKPGDLVTMKHPSDNDEGNDFPSF